MAIDKLSDYGLLRIGSIYFLILGDGNMILHHNGLIEMELSNWPFFWYYHYSDIKQFATEPCSSYSGA